MAQQTQVGVRRCQRNCVCQKTVKEFTDNVALTLAQVTDEKSWKVQVDGFVAQAYWDKHRNLMAIMHKEVTKLSVMYTTPPAPTCSDEEKLFDNITKCILALVSSLYHLPLQQGQILFKRWHTFYISLFTALLQFSKSLWTPNQPSIAQCTGTVLELCSAVANLPTNNKQCLLGRLKQEAGLVVDAFTELEEAKGEMADGDNVDEDGGVVSPFDKSLIVAGLGLVKTAKMLLAKIAKSIQSNGHADTEAQITDFDKFGEKLLPSSELVDDFAASLYPPIESREVKDCLLPLANHLACLLESFKESHMCVETDSQWVGLFDNAIKHNRDKVSSLVT